MITYDEAKVYLYALKNRGSKFGIDRMRRLVEALDHPEQKFPLIHVAGTNGKGSVCAMLEAIYRAEGYKTGLFTSPHLVHLGERAQVNREALSEEEICRYLEQLRPVAEALGEEDPELHPTFFELIAAMAFLRCAAEQVDLAMIETGLGGRLDATNVVEPELSIITSISFDHMEQLGETLAKIAEEKAGIIKAGKPVLIGCLPREAEVVIRRRAAERGSPLYSIRERFTEDALPETNLVGQFQRWNAAVAAFATELLKERFPVRAMEGLCTVDWPGRWQRLEFAGRTLILDSTHNSEGAQALSKNLQEWVETSGRKPIIVAGTLGLDRARTLMESVVPYAEELYLVQANQARATSTVDLESCLPPGHDLPVHHALLEKLFPPDGTLSIGVPGGTVLVTGSIYLIGEILERISKREGSGGALQDRF